MISRSHNDTPAEAHHSIIDAMIVGSDHRHVDKGCYTFVDALDDRFAPQLCQGLAGEASARIASGNDSNHFHDISLL
jgi:hypothetical protein